MSRDIQTGTAVINALKAIPQLLKGGTNSTNEAKAAETIGALSIDALGLPNGPAKLDSNGFVPPWQMPLSTVYGPTIDGPENIYIGQTVQFVISNYDVITDYVVAVSAGTVSVVGDKINFIAPSSIQNIVLTVNGRECKFLVKAPAPLAPNIINPINNSTNLNTATAFTSSAFTLSSGSATHACSDWQVSMDPDFISVVAQAINDPVNKTSWTATGLLSGYTYFARVRYKASDTTYGAWSPITMFTIVKSFAIKLEIKTNIQNYDMKAAAAAAGWNTLDPLNLEVFINTGLNISSSDVNIPAFSTGVNFPLGSSLTVINQGVIQGFIGTTGGPAFNASFPVVVDNSKGSIIGGAGSVTNGPAAKGNSNILWKDIGYRVGTLI